MSDANPGGLGAVVVAIDAGTTGIRALAVDDSSRILAAAYREFTQHFPRPGWVEHDPAEILATTDTVLAALAADPRIAGRPIAAIGVTNQRETAVAWSRSTGEPRHRAIVWQDRRTADRCAALAEAGELPRVRATTGLVLDPYFTASKFEWLLTEGGVAADADLALGTIDTWIVAHLTGRHVTDPSNAARTMLFDLASGGWSAGLCDLFGVPASALAEVVPSCGRVGVTRTSCPLGAGIPVSGIAGDQQSALFGQACFAPGMSKNTYGTGSFVLMNVGTTLPEPTEGLLTTTAWTVPAAMLGEPGGGLVTHYALEGAIFVTGAAVQWLRDGLGIIERADETEALAASVSDTAGVVLVPAFTGLGSPYWDPFARGAVLGISRGTTRAHLARAVVESMAFQTRDVVEAMTLASGAPLAALRVDGGAAAMDLLLELVAEQLGVPVTRAAQAETTALGAAYLAGLAEGVWSTTAEVTDAWAADARVEPAGADRSAVDAAYAQWRRAVDRSRGWAR